MTQAPDVVPPSTDDAAAIRRLEDIGEERFDTGISYTRLVTPVGRIYEGHSIDRVGSHTRGHNTVGAAYALVGDYAGRAPTSAQRGAIATDMVALHRAGAAARHTLNGGHTDAPDPDGTGTLETACPGAAALAAISDINARANRLWVGAPDPQEDDMFCDIDRRTLGGADDRAGRAMQEAEYAHFHAKAANTKADQALAKIEELLVLVKDGAA